jgi:SAM-dependent methyltransferase
MPPDDTRTLIQRQFTASSAAYVVSPVHASGPDLPIMVETAAPELTDDVLDAGCGAGFAGLALAPSCRSVVGIDITGAMLETAREVAASRGVENARYEYGDACKLPFEAGSFDIVLSRFCAHHYADPVAAVAESWRVLRPGGRLVLVDTVAPEDPALDTYENAVELLRDASHVRNWRASEWMKMFQAAAFEPEIVYRDPVVLDGADWVKRMQTPASKVAMIRELFSEATPQQRAAFDIRDNPWGFSIPTIILRGMKPA